MSRARSLLPLIFVACAHHPANGLVPAGTPPSVDIAASRARGGGSGVTWSPWTSETFARARREGRFVLVDGAAEWCHWCHVMDETTYRDPAVLNALGAHWVTVRVDIDSRPDLAARYAAWGWPATVVFAPDGRELGRYRGYQPPDRMLALLDAARTAAAALPAASEATDDDEDTDAPPTEPSLSPEALATLGPWVARIMDDTYDTAQGSWGTWQKVALGSNLLFELRRVAHGDTAARERVTFTLRQQRALIDPVWGGVDQYSAGSTWTDPHFEKLMSFQAGTIEATATAWTALHDADALADARRIAGFVASFLTAPSGAFLPSQDADVNAHDRASAFVDGHVYQALDDAHRRALGLPRVDPHVYAHENGLAITALATLAMAGPDADALTRAGRAADYGLEHLVTPAGGVRRTPDEDANAPRYLADAAAFGRGLVTLSLAVPAPQRLLYLDAAKHVGHAILRDFSAGAGALWDTTGTADGPLPRGRAVDANIAAVRLLAMLNRVTGEVDWRTNAVRVLAAVATPSTVSSLGRDQGELLLALDDAGVFPWDDLAWTGGERPGDHNVLTVSVGPDALEVRVRATEGEHLNNTYPTSLDLVGHGAALPGVLGLSGRGLVSNDERVFRARLGDRREATVIRGVVRFALCGADTCLPRERWFTVTAPGVGRRATQPPP